MRFGDNSIIFDRVSLRVGGGAPKPPVYGFICRSVSIGNRDEFKFSSVVQFKNALILFAAVFKKFNFEPHKQAASIDKRILFELSQGCSFSDWETLFKQECDHQMPGLAEIWNFEL